MGFSSHVKKLLFCAETFTKSETCTCNTVRFCTAESTAERYTTTWPCMLCKLDIKLPLLFSFNIIVRFWSKYNPLPYSMLLRLNIVEYTVHTTAIPHNETWLLWELHYVIRDISVLYQCVACWIILLPGSCVVQVHEVDITQRKWFWCQGYLLFVFSYILCFSVWYEFFLRIHVCTNSAAYPFNKSLDKICTYGMT